MTWTQDYDPIGNVVLSTVLAALPVVTLLTAIAWFRVRIHYAALLGLAVALAVALGVYKMPGSTAAATTLYGAGFGLFPIGWIILNLMFLYQLTVDSGLFGVLRQNLAALAPDPRVQVILICFSFGAFLEGAAGFGTPVAVTAAILLQLGFKPLSACGLSLIANTAPVAFGGLGTPIIALSKVTGFDELILSKMIGRQLPFFSLLVPFWVVWAQAGLRGMIGVWPAALTAGVSFAIPQFLISNLHGPWLVDIGGSLCSISAVVILLKFWQPKTIWKQPQTDSIQPADHAAHTERPTPALIRRAWTPWILLSVLLFLWGLPPIKQKFNELSAPSFQVVGLHQVVLRAHPVVPEPTPENPTKPENAVYKLNWLSATGSAIIVSAIIAGLIMGFSLRTLAVTYLKTLYRVRFSLITIMGMLALGFVTKYSGTDATLGLALANTGVLYPFFGTLLGWLGVALTGSDTASNVLFGSLQTITAEKTGVDPVLMASANSSGGVMGKMIDAQSIVVASTASNWYGHEGAILRYVFFHSIALGSLVGLLVCAQAYLSPFTEMVPALPEVREVQTK
jgi:lactate permease